MSPLPKLPAYGDASKLAQLANGTKQIHGTYGPLVQRNAPGRPNTGQQQQAQPMEVPQDHHDLGTQLAEAEANVLFWQDWQARYPGPNSDYYATQAEIEVQKARETYHTATPNLFE